MSLRSSKGIMPSRNAFPGSGSVNGSESCGPAMIENNKAVSATVFAIGPVVERRAAQPKPRFFGILPIEGLNPTTLQKLAGFLSDPPMSLPSASLSISVAKATAAPPLLPPGVFVKSYGLRVFPKS